MDDETRGVPTSFDALVAYAEAETGRANAAEVERDAVLARVAEMEARIAGALAETRRVSSDRDRTDVSCGGRSVNADGCFAADVAARARAALSPTQPKEADE